MVVAVTVFDLARIYVAAKDDDEVYITLSGGDADNKGHIYFPI